MGAWWEKHWETATLVLCFLLCLTVVAAMVVAAIANLDRLT